MIIPAVYVHAGFGLLLAGGSLPLAIRRVPMNRIYGIRIPEAFVSNAHWLDINAYGGRLFFVYGTLLSLFALFTRDRAPAPTSIWSPVFIVSPLLLCLALLPLIRAYARRRVRQGPADR